MARNINCDVLIIVEGTYPYVLGGVSNWLHDLISNLPDTSFHIVHLCAYRQVRTPKYILPKNCTLSEHALFEYQCQKGSKHINRKDVCTLERFYHDITNETTHITLERWLNYVNSLSEDSFNLLQDGSISWSWLIERYHNKHSDKPFTDFFWLMRNFLIPIINTLIFCNKLPKAKTIHTLSTGYAGLLALLSSQCQHVPLVLTEHGLYTYERKIEMLEHQVSTKMPPLVDESVLKDFLNKLYMHFYENVDLLCYQNAYRICSLSKKHQLIQTKHGAPPDKTMVIPNGVNSKKFAKIKKIDSKKPHIALIGRVVSIKDIKTFIYAIKALTERQINMAAGIYGTVSEEPQYASACKKLIETLNISDQLKIHPYQPMEDILSQTTLAVLSSISEGQPLVILEAFAAGIPVISTDVGACRELIETPLPSGEIVPIANPSALANAIDAWLKDNKRYRQAQLAAKKKAVDIYDEKKLYSAYQQLYQEATWQA